MSEKLACVVTTIQEPTPAMRRLSDRLMAINAPLIVVGDKKGPARFDLPGARFVSLAEQLDLPFALAKLLPTGHYVRKNLGYLLAIASGATCVYETDDDNIPTQSWQPRALQTNAVSIDVPGWFNVYSCFTDQIIWPRGFPLSQCRVGSAHHGANVVATPVIESPIQQDLTDIAPDVDAVWRLAIGSEPFHFEQAPSIHLAPGCWCPFNSQATWWFKSAFPLLYLPSTCTFRMTDIWRSFIAQRCLWEMGGGITFHAPQVQQERNPHDLLKDFEDEVPGYLLDEKIARILDQTSLHGGEDEVLENLFKCYEALVKAGVSKPEELKLLEAWIGDIRGHQKSA